MAHSQLQSLRCRLQEALNQITAYRPSVNEPPVIDSASQSSGTGRADSAHSISGLRLLRDEVKRDLYALDQFLARPGCDSLPAPSTNAPYLLAVWKALLSAPPPITYVWRHFPISLDSKGATSSRRNARTRDPGVKVDIVADDGRQWIRVNTIKNSRILAELREMDSYSTGSDSDSEIDDIPSSRVVDAGGNEGNSLLRMGRSLLDAALVNPVNYSDCSVTPTVTMLLPRLDLSNACDFDPRIQETVVLLRKWGIDTRTGEEAISLDENLHERFASHGPSTRELRITTRINLDLSMLIALVSDLTHSPLPSNEDEARQRFVPSESYRLWKNGRIASGYRTGAQDDGSDIKYSRALTTQVIQEMRSSLLLDIHDRLQSASPGAIRYEGAVTDQPVQHSTLSDVEFWTTPDARDRCFRIVEKIGGPHEKRRFSALFPDCSGMCLTELQAQTMYWKSSRFGAMFLPFAPIHVFPDSIPTSQELPDETDNTDPFFAVLKQTCSMILSSGTIPGARTPNESASTSSTSAPGLNDEIEPAAVTIMDPKLTVHTVQSMLWGASRGWTTMTANRGSVKAVLKHMQRMATLDASLRMTKAAQTTLAAVWTVEPRSLAEAMRFDFQE